jgi:hypothetical protein
VVVSIWIWFVVVVIYYETKDGELKEEEQTRVNRMKR